MYTERRNVPDFFSELRQRLRDAGFEAAVTEDGYLSVTCQKHPVCLIDRRGNVQYQSELTSEEGFYTQLGKVSDFAQSTFRYMELVEEAPPLDAYGLEGDYRLLSKFNDVVLAAHPAGHEIQFVTWKQKDDGKSLWGGHYHGNRYEAAKKDFAVRSGLVSSAVLLTDAQLAEIYRVCSEALYTQCDLSREQEKILGDIQTRVEALIPDIIEQIHARDQPQLSQQQIV